MNVLSCRRVKKGKVKKGWRLVVEMTPEEHDIMFIAGLRLFIKEAKVKVQVIPVAEADRMGLVKSGMKSVNMSKEEADVFVEMACIDALKRGVRKKWRPDKLREDLEPSIAKNFALLEGRKQKRKK